jgi:hypothetical protein
MNQKGLVLDYRTVLSALMPDSKIFALMEKYESEVDFRTPSICLDLACRALDQVLERWGLDRSYGSDALKLLALLVDPINQELYDQFQEAARERLVNDELNQWPVVAGALAFGHGIWAQDEIFFGVGVPVWTTSTAEIYLKSA